MNQLLPTRFKLFYSEYKDKVLKILDIGAGSHSASITKKWFPNCEYHGVDIVEDYDNSTGDISLMDKFFLMDLTQLKFDALPESYYDIIILSHVIEHLHNGDAVVEKLLPKLKKGGLIYIEFPGIRSAKLPSKKGTLNFYDDKTHVRIFSSDEVSKILLKNNFSIIKSGVRRDWQRILLLPLFIVYSKITRGYVEGSVFWDLLGFAEFVAARKNSN